ncbi:MAG TPA: hypothetical protein VN495_04075 [Candidatus Paceibacterota bacterium]|nr:hypothetical protein [Candidatus Paceibacterota bacterium]
MPNEKSGLPQFEKPQRPGEMAQETDSTGHEKAEVPQAQPEQAPRLKETPPEGPLRDILDTIDHAPHGGIVFLHGVVAKAERSEASDITKQKNAAGKYIGAVEKYFEEDDEVVVLSAEKLQQLDVRKDASGADARLQAIAQMFAGKTIVMDLDPLINDTMYKPWEAMGESLDGMMKLKGDVSRARLEEWLHGQSAEKDKRPENQAQIEVVRAGLGGALDSLRAMSHLLGDRSVTLGGRDNPAWLAFLIFAGVGSLDQAAINKMLDKPHRSESAIGFLTLTGRHVTVTLGPDITLERDL